MSQGMQPQSQPQYKYDPITSSRQAPTDSDSQDSADQSRNLVAPQRPLSVSHPLDPYVSTPHDTPQSAWVLVSPTHISEAPPQHDEWSRDRAKRNNGAEHEPAIEPSEIQAPPTASTLKNEDVVLQSIFPPRPFHDIKRRESYSNTPAGLGSPQSVHSSNKTPTQADFTSVDQNSQTGLSTTSRAQNSHFQPEFPVRPRSAVSAADLAVNPKNEHRLPYESSQPGLPLQNRDLVQKPVDNESDQIPYNYSHAPKDYEDSSITSQIEAPITQPGEQNSVNHPDIKRSPDGPLYADTAPKSLPAVENALYQGAPRPFSFMDNTPNESEQHSRHNSYRAPSIDSLPGQTRPDRSPSPVSPQRSVVQEVANQRGRTGPVHYGTDHDFLPEDSQESTPKRRSRSFSRLFKKSDTESPNRDEQSTSKRRSRSISRLFKNPDINDHPAYRQNALPTRGADMPLDYYPEQLNRGDAVIPRQQATEYQLEGVGPPPAQPADNKSRSRSNSKGTSFFKTSSSPTKELRTPPNGPKRQSVTSPIDLPTVSQEKTKRVSLLRSLTGQKGHDHDQSRDHSVPLLPVARDERPRQNVAAAPRENNNGFPSRDESSKARNKLQRASTSGHQHQEQDGGKKKRFSAMGVS